MMLSMELWTLLSDIVILLAASLILGGLFARLGQSPIVGYLVAGMILGGPGSIGAIKSEHEIEAIAELGVALLLFSLGLEFSLSRVRQLGFRLLAGGAAQVLLTLVCIAIVAYLFQVGFSTSIAFGAMLTLSSTAVVLRILMERAEIDMPHGRNSLAVLLTQDVAVVPLALLVTLLAVGGEPFQMLSRVGGLIGMIVLVVLGFQIVNRIAVHALGTLTLQRNRELTVILAVVIGLGATWAAHAAGISPALGAFIAGMLLGSSPFATQIRADVSSLRVVLLTLFFGAAGMVADPVWITRNWYLVAGVTTLLMAGKFLIIAAIFLILRQPLRIAAATGLCLAQIGEFAFVLGRIARENAVISTDQYALIVSAAILSFIVTALIVPQASRFGAFVATRFGRVGKPEPPASPRARHPDIAIVGFGPAGQIAARPLIGGDACVLVIDLNQQGVRLAQQMGFLAEVGDATQSEVLEHAHLESVTLAVITIPHHHSALMVLEQIKRCAPQARVIVRSRYQLHNESFADAGAHVIVGDEEQVGEAIACHIERRDVDHPSPSA